MYEFITVRPNRHFPFNCQNVQCCKESKARTPMHDRSKRLRGIGARVISEKETNLNMLKPIRIRLPDGSELPLLPDVPRTARSQASSHRRHSSKRCPSKSKLQTMVQAEMANWSPPWLCSSHSSTESRIRKSQEKATRQMMAPPSASYCGSLLSRAPSRNYSHVAPKVDSWRSPRPRNVESCSRKTRSRIRAEGMMSEINLLLSASKKDRKLQKTREYLKAVKKELKSCINKKNYPHMPPAIQGCVPSYYEPPANYKEYNPKRGFYGYPRHDRVQTLKFRLHPKMKHYQKAIINKLPFHDPIIPIVDPMTDIIETNINIRAKHCEKIMDFRLYQQRRERDPFDIIKSYTIGRTAVEEFAPVNDDQTISLDDKQKIMEFDENDGKCRNISDMLKDGFSYSPKSFEQFQFGKADDEKFDGGQELMRLQELVNEEKSLIKNEPAETNEDDHYYRMRLHRRGKKRIPPSNVPLITTVKLSEIIYDKLEQPRMSMQPRSTNPYLHHPDNVQMRKSYIKRFPSCTTCQSFDINSVRRTKKKKTNNIRKLACALKLLPKKLRTTVIDALMERSTKKYRRALKKMMKSERKRPKSKFSRKLKLKTATVKAKSTTLKSKLATTKVKGTASSVRAKPSNAIDVNNCSIVTIYKRLPSQLSDSSLTKIPTNKIKSRCPSTQKSLRSNKSKRTTSRSLQIRTQSTQRRTGRSVSSKKACNKSVKNIPKIQVQPIKRLALPAPQKDIKSNTQMALKECKPRNVPVLKKIAPKAIPSANGSVPRFRSRTRRPLNTDNESNGIRSLIVSKKPNVRSKISSKSPVKRNTKITTKSPVKPNQKGGNCKKSTKMSGERTRGPNKKEKNPFAQIRRLIKLMKEHHKTGVVRHNVEAECHSVGMSGEDCDSDWSEGYEIDDDVEADVRTQYSVLDYQDDSSLSNNLTSANSYSQNYTSWNPTVTISANINSRAIRVNTDSDVRQTKTRPLRNRQVIGPNDIKKSCEISVSVHKRTEITKAHTVFTSPVRSKEGKQKKTETQSNEINRLCVTNKAVMKTDSICDTKLKSILKPISRFTKKTEPKSVPSGHPFGQKSSFMESCFASQLQKPVTVPLIKRHKISDESEKSSSRDSIETQSDDSDYKSGIGDCL